MNKRTKKSKKFTLRAVVIVRFSDLSGHLMENGGFARPSYGDYGTETLVWPRILIDELERRDEDGADGPPGHLQPLILELKSIPAGVMVNIG